MALAVEIVSWGFIILGSFFTIVGMLGLLRMPELFARMHAASVMETLGAGFLIFGMLIQAGVSLTAFKLFFILALFLLTAPVVTHALAQTALHEGVRPILSEDRRPARDGDGDKKGRPS
jgi:multicomponent Na+:H+ antiporter subunit G